VARFVSVGQCLYLFQQTGRIGFNADQLGPVCLSGNHPDSGLADPELFGDQLFKRPVGLVVFGHGPDARLQPDGAGRILDQSLDPVDGGSGCQPNRKLGAVTGDRVPVAQKNIGAIEVAMKVRTKKIAISNTIGEISSPPRSGMIRRIGLSAGSVAL
jgi:hypothetical protein